MDLTKIKGKIGLIDNELCTRPNHSFPNLAIMKISAYYKARGCKVRLISFNEIDPSNLFNNSFDAVFVSKVFSDTITPKFIDDLDFVHKGGSGFFYDKAEPLPYDIEHSFPDYELYSNIASCKHDYYTKYSIGFITRGCIRQCPFCINRNSKKVESHSKLSEFVDKTRPYIMLLDDNITAYKGFYETFKELNKLNIPFVFKQGMDFRLLTLNKMKVVFNSNYAMPNGRLKTFHYAFDDIEDAELIEKKLKIYYENTPYKHNVWFYVLVGFDRTYKYRSEFYLKDLEDMLKRIEILFKYNAFPYIMLHKDYSKSPFQKEILSICRLCNFPALIGTKTIGESLIKANKIKTHELIKKHFPKYLELKMNTKMFKSKLPDKAKR